MTLRYELRIAGPLPATAAALIRSRFGELSVRPGPPPTVLTGTVADQAALRALLGLVWDTGACVQSVTLEPDGGACPS